MFAIPSHVLQALRARRLAQRLEREHARAAQPAKSEPMFSAPRRGGFLSRLAAWLDAPRRPDMVRAAERFADQFVTGMRDLQDEVEAQYDAFLLDPGMGPMTYLTANGRVLWDMRTWDGDSVVVLDELDKAIGAIVVGVENTGIEALYELLPTAPDDAQTCPMCRGTRRSKPVPEFAREMICGLCAGRGWATATMIELARSRGMRW